MFIPRLSSHMLYVKFHELLTQTKFHMIEFVNALHINYYIIYHYQQYPNMKLHKFVKSGFL